MPPRLIIVFVKLDSLRWFSQRRSPTPHFWRCAPRWGLWPPNSNSADIFVQCTYSPSFIILCLLVRKLSCWQTNAQTNRQTNKQTPLKSFNAFRYATTLGKPTIAQNGCQKGVVWYFWGWNPAVWWG